MTKEDRKRIAFDLLMLPIILVGIGCIAIGNCACMLGVLLFEKPVHWIRGAA